MAFEHLTSVNIYCDPVNIHAHTDIYIILYITECIYITYDTYIVWCIDKVSQNSIFSIIGGVCYFLLRSITFNSILFYKATFILWPQFDDQCLNTAHLISIFFWRQFQWKQPISANGLGPSKSQIFLLLNSRKRSTKNLCSAVEKFWLCCIQTS